MSKKYGNALRIKEIKKFIEQSSNRSTYNTESIYDYHIDTFLSYNFVHVYYNMKNNQCVIVVHGSATLNNAIIDLRLLFGYKDEDRFGIAKIILDRAYKKYGPQNTTILGSSLGGLISEDLGKDSHNIISFNKASIPSEINKKNTIKSI